ncbi:MAG: hypothetical protein IJI73_08295, partial [Kiritimatiellae bacterium]|nr:hypothetical protein [Kiritimatiellia bacterium]
MRHKVAQARKIGTIDVAQMRILKDIIYIISRARKGGKDWSLPIFQFLARRNRSPRVEGAKNAAPLR